MCSLLNLCNSVIEPVDRAAEFTDSNKKKPTREELSEIRSNIAFKQNKTMRAPYSPIWTKNEGGKGRRVSTIKFEGGKRWKLCSIGKDWHPADTEHFNINSCSLIGMTSECRKCGRKKQRVQKDSYKKSVK